MKLRETALEAMNKYGTDTTKRMYFTEFSVSSPENLSYCVAIPSDSKGENVITFREQTGICLYHHGSYEDIPRSCKKLIDYARENGINTANRFRYVYIEGPPQHKDKSKFITQIILLLNS